MSDIDKQRIVTPTAAVIAHDNPARRVATARLLHRLRAFMAAYPVHEDDPMPEHDVVWMAYPDGGPESTILDAIKANPALWAHALPEEVCIVPKDMLKRIAATAMGVGRTSDMVEALAHHGAHLVEQHAARARYEAERPDGKVPGGKG